MGARGSDARARGMQYALSLGRITEADIDKMSWVPKLQGVITMLIPWLFIIDLLWWLR